MPEIKRVELLLVAIICLLCVVIGVLLLSPPPGTVPGTGNQNLPVPETGGQSGNGLGTEEYHFYPTTEIVITNSSFKQDEPDVRVVAGFFKNTGNDTITAISGDFNLTDQDETEFYRTGYITAGIEFLPDQTRDFQVIFTKHNNMTKIKDVTFYAMKK